MSERLTESLLSGLESLNADKRQPLDYAMAVTDLVAEVRRFRALILAADEAAFPYYGDTSTVKALEAEAEAIRAEKK